MTPALLKSSKTKDKMHRKCIGKQKDSPSFKLYIRYRNTYNKIKRICKQTYFANELSLYQNDLKKTWKTLKSLIGKTSDKSGISDMFNINNNKITNAKTISDKFCEYFSEIGHRYASSIPSPNKPFQDYLQHANRNSFFMMPTDPIEVSRIITSLKPKTSSGHDGISSKLLKCLTPSITVPISIIINKSFQTGIVPGNMKIAKIIPIYKAKEKTIMGNYRSISLLPSTSKILEKAVHQRLYDYCKNKNILFGDQYGFRPKHSTTDAIAKFTAHVAKAMENKMTTMSVFLDLSKAFDAIDHATLLTKLHFYGIRGIALELPDR